VWRIIQATCLFATDANTPSRFRRSRRIRVPRVRREQRKQIDRKNLHNDELGEKKCLPPEGIKGEENYTNRCRNNNNNNSDPFFVADKSVRDGVSFLRRTVTRQHLHPREVIAAVSRPNDGHFQRLVYIREIIIVIALFLQPFSSVFSAPIYSRRRRS